MKVGYAYTPEDESFVAKACGKELRVKIKDCIEVCAFIQGKKAKDAQKVLEDVLNEKALVPIKKTKKQSGHKAGMAPYGARPVKAVGEVLDVLKAAITNAEFKGLDVDNCVVISALALRGHKMRRRRPKGRQAVYEIHLTTIQVFLEEKSE